MHRPLLPRTWRSKVPLLFCCVHAPQATTVCRAQRPLVITVTSGPGPCVLVRWCRAHSEPHSPCPRGPSPTEAQTLGAGGNAGFLVLEVRFGVVPTGPFGHNLWVPEAAVPELGLGYMGPGRVLLPQFS